MTENSLIQKLKSGRLYFDGATGTELLKMGLKAGESPEVMNLYAPESVEALHRAYLNAGADIIKTNTFGASPLKFENYAEIIRAGVSAAKRAVGEREGKFVALDIGPTGRILEPLGDLAFERAVELFASEIRAAEGLGADLILIETMSDTLEAKAAVIAAKENSTLPVFVTCVYDASGKMLTGASVEVCAAILEGLGVSALGMNCSLGPDKMTELLPRLASATNLPIIVNPNAGLPEVGRDGSVSYSFDKEKFCEYMKRIAPYASVLGGCCGTTPEYISALRGATEDIPLLKRDENTPTRVASFAKYVEIGGGAILVGERLNPTGKPRLKEALRLGNMGYILEEAVKQAEGGVHVLDVNVGLPDIDEVAKMREVVLAVQAVTDLPLQIDTANPEALAAAMRIYNGKPLVNSVNGSEKSMNSVFPLVKKYGGAVIALTLDEDGIPETAEGRVAIAMKIIKEAQKYGIKKSDIIVDPLALAISADSGSALTTLRAVRMLRAEGIYTSLGISNVSFGLPNRDIINGAFLTAALTSGLDVAIVNPSSEMLMNAYYSTEALLARDELCEKYIAYGATARSKVQEGTLCESEASLKDAIIKGLCELAGKRAAELLKSTEAMAVIEGQIIPALDEVGAKFERSEIFLPSLLKSAEAACAAFELVKGSFVESTLKEKGEVVLATVEGDMHDIGKNIVKVIIESHGYTVYDLGRNVCAESILDVVKKRNIRLVGLSALMTTTVAAMERTVKLLHDFAPNVKVMVGGAVMNPEYAKMIGADFYGEDAMAAAEICKSFFKSVN